METKFQRILLVMTENELNFLSSCSSAINQPIWQFVEKSLHFFNEMGNEEVVEKFKKKNSTPRNVKLWITIPENICNLLKEISDKFHISYSELIRVSALYYGSTKYIIPAIGKIMEEFEI